MLIAADAGFLPDFLMLSPIIAVIATIHWVFIVLWIVVLVLVLLVDSGFPGSQVTVAASIQSFCRSLHRFVAGLKEYQQIVFSIS